MTDFAEAGPPSHYHGANGIDPWTFIDAQGLGYYQGSVVKYVTRAGRKEGESALSDYVKARNFINHLIQRELDRE